MHTEWVSEVAQSCPTLYDPMDCIPPAPPSTESSRQEYWSGLPFPSLGDLSDPGIKPGSPTIQAGALLSEPRGKYTPSMIKTARAILFLLCFLLKYKSWYGIYMTVNLALFVIFLLLLIEYAHILEVYLLSASYIIPLKAWGRGDVTIYSVTMKILQLSHGGHMTWRTLSAISNQALLWFSPSGPT